MPLPTPGGMLPGSSPARRNRQGNIGNPQEFSWEFNPASKWVLAPTFCLVWELDQEYPSVRIPRIVGHELYLIPRIPVILRLGAAGDRAQHTVFHRSKRQVASGPENP